MLVTRDQKKHLQYLTLKEFTYFNLLHFYTSWKHQKTRGFRTFSWGIKMEHWTKMGWTLYDHGNYSTHFGLLPLWHRKLSFQINLHVPGDAGGEATWRFLSFPPTGVLATHFHEQEISRKKNEKITTFKTLYLGLFVNTKKLYWGLSFQNSIQNCAFLPFTRPKNVFGIIPGAIIIS